MNLFWGSKNGDDKLKVNQLSAVRSNAGSIKSWNSAKSSIKETSSELSTTNSNSEAILSNFPRILERRFGESLGFRAKFLNEQFENDSLPIALPDLVHFTTYDKYYDEEKGFYFHALGIDYSNGLMPVRFLNNLIKANPYLKNSNFIITCCSLNLFSQLDVRIRYESETKVQINAIDINQPTVSIPMTEKLWDETFVSSCIRTIITNIDREKKIPGLLELPVTQFEKIIKLFCIYLPRYYQCGFDSTKSINLTIINNYLTQSLLFLLGLADNFVESTILTLQKMMEKDSENSLIYQIVIIAIMEQNGEMEVDFVNNLHLTIEALLKVINEPSFNNNNKTSFFILNSLSDLLNIQAKFLIENDDIDLAWEVAKLSTELASDSFTSWYLLSRCYIKRNDFENALLAMNSMPTLNTTDKNRNLILTNNFFMESSYRKPNSETQNFVALSSYELSGLPSYLTINKDDDLKRSIFGRTVLFKNSNYGRIDKIWDQSVTLGPIFGPQSVNLLNFVAIQEVNAVKDVSLLQRNSLANQLSWFETRVYSLLNEIIFMIGWNDLLQIRSKTFVMEKEYYIGSKELMVKNSGRIPNELRQKRLCEKWLDRIFLDLYEDLTIANSFESLPTPSFSNLEWELLGLTLARTYKWTQALACLRTSIQSRFDIVGCEKIIEIFLNSEPQWQEHKKRFDHDLLLKIIAKRVAYCSRFNDNTQFPSLKALQKLCKELGTDTVKSAIAHFTPTEPRIVFRLQEMVQLIELISVS